MHQTIFRLIFAIPFIFNVNSSAPPKIESSPNSIIVNASDPVTLECRATGDPKPNIKWFKDGLELNISSLFSKYTLIHDSNLFIFSATLGKSNKTDAGVYYCKAENEHGIVYSSNASLIITYLRDDFREIPKSRQVNSGTQVIMDCKAPKGYPEPILKWEKNGEPINYLHQFQYQIVPNGTLIIKNATLNDNGEYVCIAKNDAGSKRSSPAYLNVFEKPNFLIRPESSKYQIGTQVELKCEASGFPKPQIEWKKNLLYENLPTKSQIKEDLLIIPNIQIEDEGEYVCVATNQLASVETKSYLVVYEKPIFTKIMPNLTVGIETKSLIIECNAKGKPQPIIYWAKSATSNSNNQEVTITQDDFIILENGNLFIERLSKKYEGTYLCQASNEYGNVETKTYLKVKPIQLKPPPLIVYQPQNQTIPINTYASLECLSSMSTSFLNQYDDLQLSDKIQIRWFKNEEQINLLKNDNLKYHLTETGSLSINSVQKSDSGSYKCVATNKFGQTSSLTAYLNVESPNNQYVEFQRNHDTSALPSAPTQPIIFKISSKSVSLSWQPSSHSGHSHIRNYMIEYFSPEWSNNLSGWIVLTDNIPSHKNSYVAENLNPDTYYMFIVRAQNDQGYGPPSQVSDLVRTQFEPFFVYSNKKYNEFIEKALTGEIIQLIEPADVISSTSINITWKLFKSVYLIQGYFIKYKPIGSKEYQIDTLNTNKQNYYLLNNLAKFTMYEILIEPFYGSFKGIESNTIQAKTKEDIPSHSPVNLQVEIDSIQSISIKWQPPPQNFINGIILGYKILCLVNETKNTINLNTNSTTRAIILGNLIENMKYCIKVSAYTKVGIGPYTLTKCLHLTNSNLIENGQETVKEPKNFLIQEKKQNLKKLIHESWFIILMSILIGFTLLTCIAYSIWFYYKRRAMINKSSSKKYFSNNSTLSNHKIDQKGNRYNLVGNDTQIWLDTFHSSSNHSNQDPSCFVPDLANSKIFVSSLNNNHSLDKKTIKSVKSQSPGPQYAEIYASNTINPLTNPYASTGLFLNHIQKNDFNMYNILNYQADRTNKNIIDAGPKYSSYTIELLNDSNIKSNIQQIDKKKLIKYLKATQSQTNTPKMQVKNLQNRVKSVETSSYKQAKNFPLDSNNSNSNAQKIITKQKDLIDYFPDLQQTHQSTIIQKPNQPNLPTGPPPALPHCILNQHEYNIINNSPYNLLSTEQNSQNQNNHYLENQKQRITTSNSNSSNSKSSSIISNFTGNSTLSRNNQISVSPCKLLSSTFTAQQYINRTTNFDNIDHKNLNLYLNLNHQKQQQQEYSSISPEDEMATDDFKYIQNQDNQSQYHIILKHDTYNCSWNKSQKNYQSNKQNITNDVILMSACSYNNLNDDLAHNSNYNPNKPIDNTIDYNVELRQSFMNKLSDHDTNCFLYSKNHPSNSNDIFISDEMPQTVL